MEDVENGLRDFGLDENAAQDDAQNDRAHGEALNPAVGNDELLSREELRQDSVLCG